MPEALRRQLRFIDVRGGAPLKLVTGLRKDGKAAGRTSVEGFSDAGLTETNFAPPGNVMSCFLQCAAAIDWKTPLAMKEDDVAPQLIAQLLALVQMTRRPSPILIAGTDLATAFRFLMLEGRVVYEFLQSDGSPLTIELGLAVLCHYLPMSMDAVRAFIEEHRRVRE